MAAIKDRIAALSPAQRALLELRLKKRDTVVTRAQVIPRQANRTSAPLSFAQQGLWFLDQLQPHNPAYNRPAFLRLIGPLNVAALEQSLSEIVNRHEALRTTFAAVEGQPVQLITPSYLVTIPIVDLSHLSGLERTDQVERLAAQEAQRPFDLARGPQLRASLLRLDSQEHILLLTIHHIAFDGWSMTLLCEELATFYGAFSAGRPSPLPELPIQYADFAVWQRQQLQGETLENHLLYWRQQLSGAPAVLELPTDRPRPAVQTFRGARQSRLLPKALSESLKTLSRQEGVTLFMTLLAVFKVLLHRYTGQTDIIIGSPIAGRTHLEMEGLIGLFVNMLALRTDLSGNPSFRELLERVRKVTVGAYANQDLPFDKLVEELKPQRDLSRTPLFQVMFQLRNVPKKAAESSGLRIEECVFDNGVARLDLSLEIDERTDGLFCVFDYNTDLFDTATIERMVAHFQILVEGIVANPEQRLADLSLLTDAERQKLLVEWNNTTTDYPRDQCLHQLFEAQVEQTPDAVAVVFEDAQLTYRELNHRANQLAHHLRALAVGPEVLVGLCMERSLEMVVGVLGILKAGGAYVPLDPAHPRERLTFMLEDAQVPVLLTQQRLVGDLPSCESRIVCLDADWEVVAQRGEENLTSGVAANNLAYVIYTSGSTGTPKGVMNTHRGICNRLLWMQDIYQLTQADRVLQKTPFSFDVSVWEFFWPLMVGARLIMARPGGHQDSAYLVKLIAERQITTLHFVPSMLPVFLEEQGLETCNCLRRVICGGEALPIELQERFFARLDAELHNLYGPTEASVDVTSWACKRESHQRTVPIGRPIANMQIYLLDSHLQPVPVGVPGELHIGGVGLARGYLNRPELTAEKFIPNPFSEEPGARLYKTGDLARYRPDGNIEFLGRLDHQVKIRGFRIELGEIEAVLGQHPAVRAAVVLAQEDASRGKRLLAYIVPNQGQAPTTTELRHFLKEKLPDYMVPSAFVLVEALPLTPNGKVDRRALSMLGTTRPVLTAAERQQLLVEWNDTKADYPQDKCIHQLFEEQAERTPHAVAVVFERKQLIYAQLNIKANQLAHHLQALGVGPEVRVGICVERSLEMTVGLLGILKAGGAYVPLDPAYPKERLAFMLADTQAPVLLTQQRLVAGLPEHAARVVCLDVECDAITTESVENPVSGVTVDNLAYVIYTSGSTGKPKGVAMSHRSLCNLLSWQLQSSTLPSKVRTLQFTSLSFDVSFQEIFSTWCAGGTLVLISEEARRDAVCLWRYLTDEAVVRLFLPFIALQQLAEVADNQGSVPSSVREIITAGEQLQITRPIASLFGKLKGCTLHNQYGPCESHVVTAFTLKGSPSDWPALPPIGRPIANTQIYLLDSHLQLVPVGVAGELHIGGVGLAWGYLNRPELTAEKFIPNPFSAEPDARLYKTGDLARYRPDGNIEFLGRTDQQVKIRGFRIELGEIEAALGQHPAVRAAVVLASEDQHGDKRLVAYVVPDQEQKLTTSVLYRFLEGKLPDHMVPSAFVLTEALPLTPTGKVDRRALAVPDRVRPHLDAVLVPPRTPTEEVLARIWTHVLGIEPVGIHDNFFELGGDSILGFQIIARANKVGLRLTPRQLFQHPTIAELAVVAGTTPAIQAEQGLVTGPVPLTPIQHWFFEQNLPDAHHWNQAILLEVQQALDPSLLEKVVQHLLVHHDALRLRYVHRESGWQQAEADPDEKVPFTQVDFSTFSEAGQGPAIEVTAAELQATLNLSEGPLVRVGFFNLGPHTPSRLLMAIHHLAIDGVSWRILLEDFQTAYQQLSRGEAIQLPSKTTSFKHWAQRLMKYAQSVELRQELDYWLAEPRTRVSPLPMDYPGGGNTEASARTVSVSLSAQETTVLLHEIHEAYHTQINDVLLTALLQALTQWTGAHSLLIDLEGHGREEIVEDVDLSRTVGWFTSIFPVLLDLGDTSHPGDALKVVKEQLRRIPHKGIGYGVLRYLSGDTEIANKLRVLPQAEVSFNYLGQFDQVFLGSSRFQPARESSGPERSPAGIRSHLLYVKSYVVGGQLQLVWTYSENIHRRSTIERVAEGYRGTLRSLIHHCQSSGAGRYTPCDFPEAELNQEELDALIAQLDESGA